MIKNLHVRHEAAEKAVGVLFGGSAQEFGPGDGDAMMLSGVGQGREFLESCEFCADDGFFDDVAKDGDEDADVNAERHGDFVGRHAEFGHGDDAGAFGPRMSLLLFHDEMFVLRKEMSHG